MSDYKILQGDCVEKLNEYSTRDIQLTFLDPPFNQGKEYRYFDDAQPKEKYWSWLKEVLFNV